MLQSRFRVLSCLVIFLGATAPLSQAQHGGDVAVGRTSAGQLTIGPLEKSWNPALDTGLLKVVNQSYRSVDPGFDANFLGDSSLEFYALEDGADIWLVAAEDMSPAFSVEWGGTRIQLAGESIPLGGSSLHKHPRYQVDASQSPPYDPIRLTWSGVFTLQDQGSTGYAESEPFTLYFATVKCLRGDVNNDGEIDFNDIDPFVAALIDPEDAAAESRCAADVNRDGYVTFDDIDPFVEVLIG